MRTLTRHEIEIVDLALLIVSEGYRKRDAAHFALTALPDPDTEFAEFLLHAN